MNIAEIDLEALELDQSEKIFQSLSVIFPDADPNYLLELSVTYSLDSENLNRFISNLIESKSYPKKTDEAGVNNPVPDNTGLHRLSIEAFTEKFKDPLKNFSERDVGKFFFSYSRRYLRDKFKNASVLLIAETMKTKNENLTLSFISLLERKPDRSSKRTKKEVLPYRQCKDERFLDEIFFLDYYDEITKYVSEKDKMKQLQLETARLNNELMECQCCFNDEVFTNDIVTCVEGHIFCKDCVKRSVEIAVGDGKIEFSCLADCNSHFQISSLKDLLSNTLYKKIVSQLQESEIKLADVTGICFCPFCEYAEVLPEDEKVLTCQMCKKESCKFCNDEAHIPLTCKENEEKHKISARKRVEDKMTEALLRECYCCKKKFIKRDGCNKMVCLCGAIMCYICRKPIDNYSHFEDNRREVNTGASTSKKVKKCPLWSNNEQLHADIVVEAAEIATAELKTENPNLNFETKDFLKGLKRKSK